MSMSSRPDAIKASAARPMSWNSRFRRNADKIRLAASDGNGSSVDRM
jgi:hypothetical protein